MSVENNEFPKYELIVNGRANFYILKDAGLLFGDSSKIVVVGDFVLLNGKNKKRSMKLEDKEWIKKISEEYIALKPSKPKK